MLCTLATVLVLTVLTIKGLALRASWLDNDAVIWFESRGGSAFSNAKSAHVIIGTMSELVHRRPLDGRLTSNLRIQASIVRNDSEELYAKLSQFSRLESIAFDMSAPQPTRESAVIDSLRLQQSINRLSRPVSLSINNHSLSPVDTPLNLTGKIHSLRIQNVHITRDFASGLPILRRLRYLEIINALIDDDAADILIERLGSNMGHVTSSQMLETTFEKLSASSHFKVTPHTQPRPLPTAPATTPQPVKSP